MRMNKTAFLALAIVCLLATTATADVTLTMSNLAANGWKATATYVWGGSTNASVTQTNDYGCGNFKFVTGSMPNSWEFQWTGISTNAFSGLSLSSITSVKIRNFGQAGDNALNWQPPTFTWVVDKGDGNPREPGVWHEYNAAITGMWRVYETGTNYSSLASLKAALPNAFFADTSVLPLDWGYASQHAFNVGNCPLYDEDRAWFSGASGYVDWFKVGVNGVETTYNLVPEPGTLAAMCMGLVGLVGSIRRRK